MSVRSDSFSNYQVFSPAKLNKGDESRIVAPYGSLPRVRTDVLDNAIAHENPNPKCPAGRITMRCLRRKPDR